MFYAIKLGKAGIIESSKYELIANAIQSEKAIGLDIETFYKDTVNYPKKKTKGVETVDWSDLTPDSGHIQYIQIYLPSSNMCVALSMKALEYNYLTDNPIVCALLSFVQNPEKESFIHNALYECLWFKSKFGVDIVNAHCTMLASQFNNAGLHFAIAKKFSGPNKLGTVVKMVFGLDIDKSEQTSNWSATLSEEQKTYMLLDPFYAFHLGVHFKSKFQDNPAYKAEQGSIPCFNEMNYWGVPCDIQKMNDLLAQYQKVIAQLHNKLLKMADDIFEAHPDFKQSLIPKSATKKARQNFQLNLNSPNQLKPFINFVLALNKQSPIPDTRASTLENLGADFPFGLLLKEYRTINKIKDYILGFIEKYDPIKKAVCGSLNILAIQGIGRSSCRKPSLQIIPKDSKVLKKYGLRSPRVAFKSVFEGESFGILDFSASHMSLAHAFSNDYTLTLATKEGVKSHYYTLKAIFKLQGRHCEASDLQTWHKGLKKAQKKDNEQNTNIYTQEFLNNFDATTRQLIIDTDNNYTLSKNAFYSFLNKASKFSLQQTFAKEGLIYSLEDCQLFLDACKDAYKDIWQFQNDCVREATRSIDNHFFIAQFDPYIYSLVAPYGVVPADTKNLWLDHVSTVITKDGRTIRQSCVYDKTDEYWTDESGELFYHFSAKTRPSQIVSNQWLSVEATIGKTLLRRLWDYFKARPEMGFKIRCFAHDEVDCTASTIHEAHIKEIMNQFSEEEFKKYSPYYVQESMEFVNDWSEK